jgi:hypothetical protein
VLIRLRRASADSAPLDVRGEVSEAVTHPVPGPAEAEERGTFASASPLFKRPDFDFQNLGGGFRGDAIIPRQPAAIADDPSTKQRRGVIDEVLGFITHT